MRKLLLSMMLLATTVWAQNPVSDALRNNLTARAKNMVAAADEMPADKFSFKPTAEQIAFGHLIMHIAESNNGLCARLTGAKVPEADVKENDSKEKLVAALKQSFDFCNTQLPALKDSSLGEETTAHESGRKATKAALVLALNADWADHYGQMATYLRLNGLLPPTAKPKK